MRHVLGPDAQLENEPAGSDLRLIPVAITLWVGVLAGLLLAVPILVIAGSSMGLAGWLTGRRCSQPDLRRAIWLAAAALLAGIVLGITRAAPVQSGPVSELAGKHAYVTVDGEIRSDPQLRADATGRSSGYVVARLRVDQVTGRGQTYDVRAEVVLVAGERWQDLLPGQQVRTSGSLAPTNDGGSAAALLRVVPADPGVVGEPSLASQATEPLRAGLRQASAAVPNENARALVPALLIGDTSLMSDQLIHDMTDSGLAHLTAVSGMNVTIVLVTVLTVARRCGARGYALPVLGVLAVVGFVLLARPEPSVVRAAVMGTISIASLTVAGRRRGPPALAAAVIVLLAVDPWLAKSVGFALSVAATAGILILVPRWTRQLSWLPAPLATAVAIPLAAQLACLPMLVGISGQVSLATVPANMAVAPAVPIVTVLAAVATAVGPAVPGLALAVAWLAGWPASWIVEVAAWCADLPSAVVPWPGGPWGIALAAAVVCTAIAVIPFVMRRPVVAVGVAVVVVCVIVVNPPTPGWPPRGAVLIACDVGQGDALVLPVATGVAVVVDTGRDPRAVERCLDDLDVAYVPVLVLTHFDADHVMGLPGVLDGRQVGRALVSPIPEPAANALQVRRWLAGEGVPMSVGEAGLRHRFGDSFSYEVVWPRRVVAGDGTASNNASIVLVADVRGVKILLTGDLGPDAQAALRASVPDLRADVLKVPHHGSPAQDERLLVGVGAEVAVFSVGDNDYGHPAPGVIETLRTAGAVTVRTDQVGTIAIVRGADGRLGIVSP